MKRRRIYVWGMALLTTALFIRAGHNSSIPPAGNTNAPGEGNCTSCHSGVLNTIVSPFGGPLSLSISENGQPFNPNNGYTPGATYTISITASVPGITRYGFQATFINPTSLQGVGTFNPGPGTTVTSGSNNRTYVSHNNDTQAPGGSKTWTFNWTAPEGPNPPVVHLYITMNAANGNGNTGGDQIYAFNAPLQPAANQDNSIQCQVTGNNMNYCPGGTITVAYQATGSFSPNNTFALEISNPDGSFPGQTIGFGSSELSGVINGTIPPSLPNGTYRVRVNSTAPPVFGEPAPQPVNISPVNAQIFGLPPSVCIFDGPVCMQAMPNGGQFQGLGVIGNCFYPDQAGEGTFIITYSGTDGGCNFFTTETITVVGYPIIEAVIAGGGMGMPYELRAIGPMGLEYRWEPGGLVGQSVFVNPSQTTTYTVFGGVPGTNCVGSDTVTVFVGGSTNCDNYNVEMLYDGPNPVCAGQNVTVRAVGPPTFGSSFTWYVNGLPYISTGDILTIQVYGTTLIQVTGTAPDGCTDSDELTIAVTPADFELYAETTPASCPQCFDGSITIYPPGLAFYQVNGINYQSNVITGLAPGFYQITAGDANGCTQTISVEVGGGVEPCTFTLWVETQPASCSTCFDGAMTIYPEYLGIYYVNNLPYFSNVITGLAPGFYDVRATDSLGCVGQVFVEITSGGGCNVDAQIFGLPNEMCVSDPPVCLQAIPGGGTFSGPGFINEFCFSPAAAGIGFHYISYSGVTPDGCEFFTSTEVFVNECGGCFLEVYAYAQPETLCVGQSTTLMAEASSNIVDFRWFDPMGMPIGIGQMLPTVPQISGLYRVVATDLTQANCEAEAYVFVSVYEAPQFTAFGQNASCPTCNDGRIVVNPPTYMYSINGMPVDASGGVISGLTPGTYSVTAMDAFSMCSSSMMVTVGFNPPACPTPTGLTASNITPTGATLSWNSVSTATTYRVRYRPVSSNFWTTVATAATSVGLIGLTPSTQYVAQVAANCNGAFSPNSGLISFTTAAVGATCQQTAQFNVFQSAPGSVLVTWTLVQAATRYQIQYKPSNSVFWTTVNRDQPFTSALITGLQAGVTYQFRMRVVCGIQNMPWQGPINITLNGKAGDNLGDDELQAALFPNPNDGEFVLSLNAIEGKTNLRVFDVTGRTVYVSTVETQSGANQFTLNLRDVLSPGLYFLLTESIQGTATVKFSVK